MAPFATRFCSVKVLFGLVIEPFPPIPYGVVYALVHQVSHHALSGVARWWQWSIQMPGLFATKAMS